MSELLFTPAAVLDLLIHIDELNDYNISLSQPDNDTAYLTIGDSNYSIQSDNAIDVIVDKYAVNEVEYVNLETYEDIADYEDMDPVTSGIIKEAFRTLLIGGLVRLTTKFLK